MQIPEIQIESVLKKACPKVRLGCMMHSVKVRTSAADLKSFIEESLKKVFELRKLENLHDIPPLAKTRAAYKETGKDPSRYRPSAEALLRRVMQGKGLYEVNNVVDVLNLISIQSGFSIGGYNSDQINGMVRMGIGLSNEPYKAIGRGALNIEGLPLLRDETGAFGSPTSDSERTMVRSETTFFLSVIFDFGQDPALENTMNDFDKLLIRYCEGKQTDFKIVES